MGTKELPLSVAMWFLSYYQTADQDTIYTTGGYNNRLLLFMTWQPLSIVQHIL